MKLNYMTDFTELPTTEMKEGRVLLDFFSVTCSPCKMVSMELDKLEQDKTVDATIFKIDVEHCPELAGDYEVFSVPTLIFLDNGVEYHRHSGFIPQQQIKNLLQK